METFKKNLTEKIKAIVEESSGINLGEMELVFPPDISLGDFTIECFSLAKQLKKSPQEIAKELAEKISQNKNEIIKEATAAGAYVNIKIKNDIFFGGICLEALEQKDLFGNSDLGKNEKVMVEYLSPNTNKPLHLGHMRNGALGMALSNILESTGNTVVKSELINDRGIHICKSMLAWKKWGNGETPESAKMKGDHFVGKWYVRFAQEAEKDEKLEAEAQAMLQEWEAGNPEVLELWKKMNQWVYEGFKKTCEELNFEFNVLYYESDTYKLGKDIIAEGLKKKIFYKDSNGSVIFDLSPEEFGLDKNGNKKKATILRDDGTSVYLTQDLGTALLKVTEQNLTSSIYITGSEQVYHFQVLFKILNSLGYDWAKKLYHLSYGMVYLPDGKMKSREGKIVDADNLIQEMVELAGEGIRTRDAENKISEEEIRMRAEKIGKGAIKFYLLRVNPNQDIYFDPKESISLDGFTGPYCQYAYARISSILKNSEKISSIDGVDFSVLDAPEEKILAQKILEFPSEIEIAAQEFNPSKIASHIFEIAKAFNQFYHQCPVLKAENEKIKTARLLFVEAAGIAIKKGLNLLGIEVLEKM